LRTLQVPSDLVRGFKKIPFGPGSYCEPLFFLGRETNG
jgi:hypothetical protein